MLTPKESPKVCGHDKYFPCDCAKVACICSAYSASSHVVCTYGDHAERIWCHRVRNASGTEFWAGSPDKGQSGNGHAEAVWSQRQHALQALRYAGEDAFECGPVQRVTDPPHVFVPLPKKPYSSPTLRKLDGPPTLGAVEAANFITHTENALAQGIVEIENRFPVSETAMTRDLEVVGIKQGITIGFPDNTPRLTVTQVELARLLFDVSPHMRAHAVRRGEMVASEEKIKCVLDVMWGDKQFHDVRENCEKTAGRVFDACRR